jgi:SAM-dependent methyltransferase
LSQNIWEAKGHLKQRQRRRAELVHFLLKRQMVKTLLDVGCAEGYATSFFSSTTPTVCGIEIDINNLRIAKKNAEFINASIENLPFRGDSFEAVCILEVLEHVPDEIQQKGLGEANYVLKNNGPLIISVPYKENIIHTKCVHCGQMTPLYGHLHSIDETYMISKLPSYPNFSLTKKYRLPNVEMISCISAFERFPLHLWMLVNKVLGIIRKGYWIVMLFSKQTGV